MRYSFLLVFLLFFIVGCSGTRPDNIGLKTGKFIDCPESPNCVSTFANTEDAKMDPISFSGSAQEAKAKLLQILSDTKRTNIIVDQDNYLHVEFTSAFFRFVDDVEFFIDDKSKKIHFRSASRLGYSDLGANRKRMDAIVSAW